MKFEDYLKSKVNQNTAKQYIGAAKRFYKFLKSNEYVHNNTNLKKIVTLLELEEGWAYIKEENKITNYKEYIISLHSYLSESLELEDLTVEQLITLKAEIGNRGNNLLKAIARVNGNGALSSFIEYLIKYKELQYMNAKTNKNIKLPHNRIIYGAPGTGKSYKLSQEVNNFERNIEIDKEEDTQNFNPNYWIATCGKDNHLWKEFNKEGIYAVGWDELEDLKQYKTKKNILKQIEAFGYSNKRIGNQWNVGYVLKKGDIIAVREGIKGKLISYGTVSGEYKYDSTREYFKQTIPVKWEKNREVILSKEQYNKNFPILSIAKMNSELKKAFLSNYLSEDTNEKFETKSISTVTRVTFYDGYTHGQFVGTYKPIPSEDGVTYKYVAGPFIKQLIEAIKNPNENYCLVIEEINRARADKVFGNIFQLLDRDEDGKSQYPVELSEDQIGYFTEELEDEYVEELEKLLNNGLSIPSNLYIWATMNSADQGVYPLDSAFKRRWNFEHIGLDDNENEFKDGDKKLSILYEFKKDSKYQFKAIEWNNFRKVINNTLLENGIQEDRLIAPFFINPNQFIQDKEEYLENIHELETNVYIDKVIMYLFEDVLRHKKKSILFNESFKSFSQLKKAYKENLVKNQDFSIFYSTILEELRKYKIEEPSDIRDKEAE